MMIGCARVSTADQNFDLQGDALEKAGCQRLFTDRASGAGAGRPGPEEALALARPGETLVAWKPDRLGRSLRHLVETIGTLRQRGSGFRSLREHIDPLPRRGEGGPVWAGRGRHGRIVFILNSGGGWRFLRRRKAAAFTPQLS